MHDTKNEDLVVVLEKIDNAIASEEDFAKIFAVELGDDAADARVLEERFGGLDDTVYEGNCMKDRIAGDEVFDVLKIVPGGQRPADLRHRAILSFSSSWVRTRPSATS